MKRKKPTRLLPQTVNINISARVHIDGKLEETERICAIPRTLEDARALYGDRQVFKDYLAMHVVNLQSQMRQEIKSGERKKERIKTLLEQIESIQPAKPKRRKRDGKKRK